MPETPAQAPGRARRLLSRRHIDVVLVEPQKSENIGAAARAMANMGLGRLILVRPRSIFREVMESSATRHARRVLEEMSVRQDLDEALAPYELVVGTTARRGRQRGPFHTPRQLAPLLLAQEGGEAAPAALLFGPERMGLATADLRRCQKVALIPTDRPETSSLNLAQAVLLLGYELLAAAGGEPAPPSVRPAPQRELAGMYEDLAGTLTRIGFLPADNPDLWLMNIKKIFNRSLLTSGECNLWRGVCRQMRWALAHPERTPENPGPESRAYGR